MRPLLLYICSLVLALPATLVEAFPVPIDVLENAEGVLFSENGEKILFYQCETKSQGGQYPRANYIHPLYDLDGNVLTEDFPGDHPHQRGIYWAWHQLRIAGKLIADPWICDNTLWDILETDINQTESCSTLRLNLQWKCRVPNNLAEGSRSVLSVVNEITSIRVYPLTDNMRKIDLEIQLLALVDDVSIGGSEDDKGYGGFCARLRLPKSTRFTAREGTIIPESTAMDAGPWVDFSARYGSSDRMSGVAIFCNATLPQFPPLWILRQEESMQNPVFPGSQAVALSRTQPTILRYRLVVHRNILDVGALEVLQQSYQHTSPVEPVPSE